MGEVKKLDQILIDNDVPENITITLTVSYNMKQVLSELINTNGYLVWQGYDGSDYEIYLAVPKTTLVANDDQ